MDSENPRHDCDRLDSKVFRSNHSLKIVLSIVVGISSTACEEPPLTVESESKPAYSIQGASLSKPLLFTVEPDPVCYFGDFDTIESETKDQKSTDFLVSLEPILTKDHKRFAPQTRRVSYLELANGLELTFDVPASDEPVHLGLFVCKDLEGQGYCSEKRLFNLAKLSEIRYLKGKLRGDRIAEADKPYYFQYVLLNKGQLRTLTDKVDSDEKFVAAALKLARQLGSATEYHHQALGRVRLLQKMLTSRRIKQTETPPMTIMAVKIPQKKSADCEDHQNLTEATDWQPEVYRGDSHWRPKKDGKITLPEIPSNF